MSTSGIPRNTPALKLSRETLRYLPPTVKTPTYDVRSLAAGVVHFGVGNFHRSHQAVYLDALLNLGRDHDWAIVGERACAPPTRRCGKGSPRRATSPPWSNRRQIGPRPASPAP